MRIVAVLGTLIGTAFASDAASAGTITVDHEFSFMLEHTSGARLAIPPSIHGIAVDDPANAVSGGPDNPLYEDQVTVLDNPLFEQASPPGSPGSVISVSFILSDAMWEVGADGIVHRDIAIRGFEVLTDEGLYTSELDIAGVFSAETEDQIFGVGPIPWFAPESITTRDYNTRGGQQGAWSIVAGSSFTVSYPAPAPGAGALLGVGFVIAGGRRRGR